MGLAEQSGPHHKPVQEEHNRERPADGFHWWFDWVGAVAKTSLSRYVPRSQDMPDDMFVYWSGLGRVQGTTNETFITADPG